MPDTASLQVGDRIRILSVPKSDLQALNSGSSYLKETVEVLTWMVGKVYVVESKDEFGKPWVSVDDYPDPSGAEHTMAIMDTESWEKLDDTQLV